MKRYLVLENGSVYAGEGFGSTKPVVGELVFNTGMSGYQESITDLSYYGQILTFTYPLIGNYGINRDDFESFRPAASAIVMHDIARRPSNWRSQMSIAEWAERHDLPGITGVDTRALTKELRDYGVLKAIIVDEVTDSTISDLQATELPTNQVAEVGSKNMYVNPTGGVTIALIDFGLKNSIFRSSARRNVNVQVFPATVDAQTILDADLDGVLLSNGPGDPESVDGIQDVIRELEEKLPLMGICLGHQLFALANGAQTMKMKFGHRGFNHAGKDCLTGKTNFTSQNHGYVVDGDSVQGTNLEVTKYEINDGSVEGLRLKNHQAFSVQYHPDAAPGPHDAEYLFDEFLEMIAAHKEDQTNA